MEALEEGSFCIEELQPVRELTTEEKIKNLKILLEKKNQNRMKIDEKLEQKRLDRFHIEMQLEFMSMNHDNYRRDDIQNLKRAIDEYNRKEELGIQIKCLLHRLKSGKNSSAQENQILREIKCLQEQKENFCANVEAKKWIPFHLQDTLNSKESIQGHLDLIFQELRRGSTKDQMKFNRQFGRLNKRLRVAQRHHSSLEKKLDSINEGVEKLYERIHELN